ncbi:unnamed protein product [Ceratitis capitata]|uniref:(Mediterranean fruit fly) hypothetical protein n=1 Tax=Ceratitis capitata TaxID=7213 RepID=A0A811VD07_CERCA|nr:unnamed protein product [Ceratitis capitata]
MHAKLLPTTGRPPWSNRALRKRHPSETAVSAPTITCPHKCFLLEKFTNLQCTAFDEGFVIFDFCRLRAVKRDVNELSIKLKFLQATDSMRNVTLRVQLMQKVSGYRPFLYDITTDLCEYLEKRNHPFLNIIFDEFSNHSLAAQKCPLV